VSDEERNDAEAPAEPSGENGAPVEEPGTPETPEAPAAPVEEPDAPEAPVEEPVDAPDAGMGEEGEGADEVDEREPEAEPAAKAKDVPPGADLEPIEIEGDRELTAEERARLEAEAEERARLEAEATAEGEEEPAPRRRSIELPAEARIQATGKRKSSVARVVISAGRGGFLVNQRELDEYFPRQHHQVLVRQPLVAAGFEESVDIRVRVHGGGVSGQAGAIRHGVARALTEIDGDLRRDLKRRGLLTRDARRKERRKAGLKKARKRPQFSKR
jgi:small subunit ribosomal protein S9